MRKKKDTDYLALSARIRVLENRLLTHERMEQMIEAKEDAEATRLMADCGYPEVEPLTLTNLEASLAAAQGALFDDLGKALEGDRALDVFQIPYDYQNAKAILKAKARGVDAGRLLVGGGRYAPQTLLDSYNRGDPPPDATETFVKAVREARDLLAETNDPQLADFALDKACYGEVLDAAKSTKNAFLTDYVKLQIDAVNLRSAVRAARSEKDKDFLAKALIPGGNVDEKAILTAQGEGLARLYRDTPLEKAAQAGFALLEGRETMTVFERLCDNALTAQAAKAKRVPFGLEPVVGYLFARENERAALRVILSGRLAGLSKDTIRERLRDAYV